MSRSELESANAAGAAMSDARVGTGRNASSDPRYVWGFNIGSAVARGSSADGPGQRRLRTMVGSSVAGNGPTAQAPGSMEAVRGFDAGQGIQHTITRTAAVAAVAPVTKAPNMAPSASGMPPAIAKEAAIASAATKAALGPAPAPLPDLSFTTPSDAGPPRVVAAAPAASAPLAVRAPIAPPPVPPPAKSFWQKLKELFGFGEKKPTAGATMSGEPTDVRSMVESVVRRARNGDQNAMALIALVRDNAQAGDQKARASYELLCEYVRCNPVENGSAPPFNPRIGADAVALSHGPKLLNPRIERLLSRFNGEGREAILHGLRNPSAPSPSRRPDINSAVRMGQIVGQARKLQAVREPGSSIAKFDTNVGWELGE
jgi:hypothetical protein